MNNFCVKYCLVALVMLYCNLHGVVAQHIVNTSCDYNVATACIDDLHPKLSWQVISNKRGDYQTAYQIVVASSLAKLADNNADMWDTRKVASSQSLYVRYMGKMLTSNTSYYWKVRIWNKDGKPSEWSKVASWQMGLLQPKDWKAHWITASKWFTPEKYRPRGLIIGAKGGWADIDLGVQTLVDSIRLFAKKGQVFPEQFTILASNDFNFEKSIVLVNHQSLSGAYFVKPLVFATSNTKAAFRYIRLLLPESKSSRVIRQLEVFSMGSNVSLMRPTKEQGTSWDKGHACFLVDGMPSENEPDTCSADACSTTAAPMFRKVFTLSKAIKKATLYYASLGMLDVTLNGKAVTKDVLDPPFTDYYKRVMYASCDVTQLLQKGNNAIGAVLANGFFSTPSLGFGERHGGNGAPQFILQAQIEYIDGSKVCIATDSTWKWQRSEVVFNDIWNGYTEDRRLAFEGWNSHTFNDNNWPKVALAYAPLGKLVAKSGIPNRISNLQKPDSISGNKAFFKTAVVGWPILRVNGKPGQVITITGSGGSYKLAPMTFFIGKEGITTISPRFIIQPCINVLKIEGLQEPLTSDVIAVQNIHANLATTAQIKSSDEYLNQLFDACMRTHISYINDFPADPNREKQGWTQDVQNMFTTAAYFTDAKALYSRWWQDMADNQDEHGYLGSVVPMVNRQVYDWNSPWWSGMIVFLPWMHYQYYGDVSMLENAYTPMCKYVDLLGKMAKTGEGKNWYAYPYFTEKLDTVAAKKGMIIWNGAGDWNNPYTKTQFAVPAPMTTMPAWFYFTSILSKSAALLGKKDDVVKYNLLANSIKELYNRTYYNAVTGQYGDSANSQTAHVLPLAVGLVPQDKYQLTYERLLDAIHLRNNHIGTGFTSTNFLLELLAANRSSNIANDIVHQKDYPSWNTLTKNGLFQEDWHGGGALMPSCGGAIGTWLFQSVLGIQPSTNQPGFKQCIILPQPNTKYGLVNAKGSYLSNYGSIEVDWKLQNENFVINVKVPFNATAIINIPTKDIASIKESGVNVSQQFGVKFIQFENGIATYELASGSFSFASKVDK